MIILASGNGMVSMEIAKKEYSPSKIEMSERNCSWCLKDMEGLAWPWWIMQAEDGVILMYVSNGGLCPIHATALMENRLSYHR